MEAINTTSSTTTSSSSDSSSSDSNHNNPHRIKGVSTKTIVGFNTFLITYTWEDTLVATNRSYGKAFGLQRKMRSFWITSPNMVMDVGAQSPNLSAEVWVELQVEVDKLPKA
ncbi:hypothetical protein DEO72_LG10g2221 [Vigna unguiculata]|uniref:Uncharacterized protein n=1 Tax=Vigna unguiculata TaxID=3917 RepID=A0A4D6NCF2_VIGUN|nr:hypothetical protein DEO72_LG10g2221 [Vigna unguiculata]